MQRSVKNEGKNKNGNRSISSAWGSVTNTRGKT